MKVYLLKESDFHNLRSRLERALMRSSMRSKREEAAFADACKFYREHIDRWIEEVQQDSHYDDEKSGGG